MTKQQGWIALFALVVLAYAAGQYWSQQHSGEFRAVLLDPPQQVQRVDVQRGEATPFRILRQADRWLLSAPKVNEEARTETVEQLLQRLQAIRTEEVVSQSPQEWEDYGVAIGQGVVVCLTYDDQQQDCVHIGSYGLGEQNNRLELYTRLQNQKEVYVINGLPLSFLDGQIDFFRNKQLLEIKAPVHKLAFTGSDQMLQVEKVNDSTWVNNNGYALDAIYWQAYLDDIRSISGQGFADDIDELSLDSFLSWQLTVYTKQDSFRLNCYSDTTKQKPFILHSDQFPKTWISSDSSGLAAQLLSPWQKWLPNE